MVIFLFMVFKGHTMIRVLCILFYDGTDIYHDGNSVRVASEVCNMVVNPLEGQQLQLGLRFVININPISNLMISDFRLN